MLNLKSDDKSIALLDAAVFAAIFRSVTHKLTKGWVHDALRDLRTDRAFA
jgi:hypothetical protein